MFVDMVKSTRVSIRRFDFELLLTNNVIFENGSLTHMLVHTNNEAYPLRKKQSLLAKGISNANCVQVY